MRNLLLKALLLLFATVTAGPVCAVSEYDHLQQKFNTGHPLVYEDAWDLWPYCYLNNDGEPEGFNVDLVRMIAEELNIPVEIRLRPTKVALEDLRDGRSDLMLGMASDYHNEYASYGRSAVQLFTHSVVFPKNKPNTVRTEDDLRREKVIVHEGSFSHRLMIRMGLEANALPYDDMKEAILALQSSQEGCILWNTMSLKWLMRRYHTDNLTIQHVDMPHGEYRFMANDSILLQAVDGKFAQLKAKRRLIGMQNKWFYPDNIETGIPSWLWNLAALLSVVAVVLLMLYLHYNNREQMATAETRRRISRLQQVVETNKMTIWTYDVLSKTYCMVDADGKMEQEFTPEELSRIYTPKDFEHLSDILRRIALGENAGTTIELNAAGNTGNIDTDTVYEVTLTPLRRNQGGQVTVILGIRTDVTKERHNKYRAEEMLSKYKSIFDTAMLDIVSFDAEGRLNNMNKRAEKSFGITLENALSKKATLESVLDDPDIDISNNGIFYATLLFGIGNHAIRPQVSNKDCRKCYELQILPIADNEGNSIGAYGTGFEVTEIAESQRKQKENIRKLLEANKALKDYVDNIDYVLKVGGVKLVSYDPDTHTLIVFGSLNNAQLRLTQSRCMRLVSPNSARKASRMLHSMDNKTPMSIDTEIETTLRINQRQLHLHVNFVPTTDENGKVTSYFGLCRDVSEIKANEALLEKETERAREVEELKNSFLRNMSYEIRTPLNAVVGFSELFEMEHTEEDEAIFIKEIKDNAAYLLNLINDILFLSRLDAHMIEISPEPCDFTTIFESQMHMGWANYKKENVRYEIENHYEELIVDIDPGNLGRIIEQISANAAQHTNEGTVRARYDYIAGKLIIAVDDTGDGISPEQLKHIYERFASANRNGTGLGIPICKELAEQMGGTLDINSEVGKGTTVWVTIPCKATSMKRKNAF